MAVAVAPTGARPDADAVNLVLDHPREVDHGRDRAQPLLGWDGGVVRRGCVKPAVWERKKVRE